MIENNPFAVTTSPPSSTGPSGPRFEAKVGGFYLLSLLSGGEPRGLPGASVRTVRFQQAAHGSPLDDVTINAVSANGSQAFLDIQAKRTIDFVRSNSDFADVVRRIWASSQKPEFATARYELAVAIARTSARIERHCQEVLHWARQLTSSASFAAHMELEGFSSQGMRDFVGAFRHHLAAAGAPVDDEAVWSLLRRFQILVFDFETIGSDYDLRARERARAILAPDQTGRAADLWSVLGEEAMTRASAGGDVDRPTLVSDLTAKRGFRFGDRPDLRAVHERLTEAASHALADIKDHIGGAKLARTELVDAGYQAIEQTSVLHIVGRSGVGKSAVLKLMATRAQTEGTVLVLTPGRIVGGGWLKMSAVIGCPVGLSELFNELGCGGGATLFVDNIDQIDDADDWVTLRDLLRAVKECRGWRAVFTVRSDNHEWRAGLPDDLREMPHQSIRVEEITDTEADVLRAGNPALSALLGSSHPARAIARNLFHLSRMIDFVAAGQSAPTLINEIDLANAWWRYGGGRSETGKWERLKLLRALGERVVARPGIAAFRADELDSATIAELLKVESLREDRAGATVAFWHDTLRDWTVGFLLDERPEFITSLPLDRPLPGSIARGLEIAARLALEADRSGARWLSLLARFECDGCHGSWRRPVLLALPRSENAIELYACVETALVAEKGRRLKEIIRLMIGTESETAAQLMARLQPSMPTAIAASSTIVVPTGPTWMPLVFWVLTAADRLPSAIIPDLAKLFQLWLIATHGHAPEMNAAILQRLYDWLTQIEEAMRPVFGKPVQRATRIDLDFDHMREVHEEIRTTFLSFCHLKPELAAQYLARAAASRPHEVREILRFPGSAVKAAPSALVDFALATLIPEEDDDDRYRQRRDYFGPFSGPDHDFVPVSPGQGPFFELLEEAPAEGLRLIRGLVEYATQWLRERYVEERRAFPVMTIPFLEAPKTFEGDFGIYQWARGGTGALVAASALMALEAWGHRQIENGRPFADVLHDVLGPSGSSAAFVCVAVDLALSHWEAAKEVAWPMLAVPELLHFDHMRFTQDLSGMGRFFTPEREPANWRVKTTDLTTRPSRHCELSRMIGNLTLSGPADIHSKLSEALGHARERIAQGSYPDDKDPINGLRATAERAWRMTDARRWSRKTLRLADGRECEGYQYQLTPEEEALINSAQASANAHLTEQASRLRIQKALEEPHTSTAEIVANGITWARRQAAEAKAQPIDDDRRENYDNQWRGRAVVMAAALAARDYDGTNRLEVEAWSRAILDKAASEQDDDVASRFGEHVCSNTAAIAAVGYAALFQRSGDATARDALFALATRQDYAVVHALCSHFSDFDRVDARLPRSIARIVMNSAMYPRRTDDPAENEANCETHRRCMAEAISAEESWLNGLQPEPAWPDLVPWHSRRRRGFRIDGDGFESEQEAVSEAMPEMYADERRLGILVSYLVHLVLGDVREWVVQLMHHLMGWTIDANNGPSGDDEYERENRPYHWNASYFDVLGILCVALPFERGRVLFMEPMTRLHDEAFHDAMASFLRGFDRATLAPDIGEPENPVAVRSLFAERLQRGRMTERLNDRVSFLVETHLGDALNAMFYQPSSWAHQGRPHIPDGWNGLLETMPVLTPIVAAAPKSGYLAVAFLTLVESYPSATLLPSVVHVVAAWCDVHGVGASFWTEHQVGQRVCQWIDRALTNDADSASHLPLVRNELGRCLDTLVRSGVPTARALEKRIIDDPAFQAAS